VIPLPVSRHDDLDGGTPGARGGCRRDLTLGVNLIALDRRSRRSVAGGPWSPRTRPGLLVQGALHRNPLDVGRGCIAASAASTTGATMMGCASRRRAPARNARHIEEVLDQAHLQHGVLRSITSRARAGGGLSRFRVRSIRVHPSIRGQRCAQLVRQAPARQLNPFAKAVSSAAARLACSRSRLFISVTSSMTRIRAGCPVVESTRRR